MDTINTYVTDYQSTIILGLCIFSLLLCLWVIINTASIRKWRKKYYTFIKVKEDLNIEDVLKTNIEDIELLKDSLHKQRVEMSDINSHVQVSIQKVAMVKYNAFSEMGGDMSFVLALLDQKDSGLLINGIHSREGCYTYVKQIASGKCDKTLSNEEKEALEQAKKQIV